MHVQHQPYVLLTTPVLLYHTFSLAPQTQCNSYLTSYTSPSIKANITSVVFFLSMKPHHCSLITTSPLTLASASFMALLIPGLWPAVAGFSQFASSFAVFSALYVPFLIFCLCLEIRRWVRRRNKRVDACIFESQLTGKMSSLHKGHKQHSFIYTYPVKGQTGLWILNVWLAERWVSCRAVCAQPYKLSECV